MKHYLTKYLLTMFDLIIYFKAFNLLCYNVYILLNKNEYSKNKKSIK